MTALSGRVALVTGASRGTGVDVARDLARAGARVAVHYRSDRAAGEEVAAAIRAEGGEAEVFQADVARADDVRRLVAQVRERLGAPGIVVNNAGPFNDAAFCELREADWDYVMNANLKAVYLTAQLVAARHARPRAGGASSISARPPGWCARTASTGSPRRRCST